VWGVIWTIIALAYFAGAVLVGLVAFKVCLLHVMVSVPYTDCTLKESAAQQKSDAKHFLPVPGSGALSVSPDVFLLSMSIVLGSALLGL
jgi:hypothetical protein